MNNTSTDQINIVSEYIKMEDFMKLMQMHQENNPYEIKLSFDKYIKSINTQFKQGCKFYKGVIPFLQDVEAKMSKKGEDTCGKLQEEAIEMLMPSMFVQNEMSFISKPFKKQFAQKTQKLADFFNNKNWEIKIDREKLAAKNTIISIGSFILKTCYGIEAFEYLSDTLEFKNSKSDLIKHLEIGIKFDFVEVIEKKPLLPLSEDDIQKLLVNNTDSELWLKLLPPDRFIIKGFAIGTFHDITKIQIHSQMRKNIANVADGEDPLEKLKEITQLFRSYLVDQSIEIGVSNLLFAELINPDSITMSLTNELDIRKLISNDLKEGRCIYSDAIFRQETIIVDDLNKKSSPSLAEKKLLKNGVQSIIIVPVLNEDNKLISIFEIGSSKKTGVNTVVHLRLKEMITLAKLMINSFSKEMDKLVDLIIRDNFTSIHPSVEWKFKEVATKYQINLVNSPSETALDPIKFENVFPLYGQADIVGSSTLRNEALQSDLIFNLKSLNNLIEIWLKHKHFYLLESYQLKIATIIEHLKDDFESSDESTIIELLHAQVHPLLEELKGRHDDLPSTPYAEYISLLDSELGIVYDKRKLFEESVTALNAQLSEFFSREDIKMQKTLPHYFEKYKTDGVEYNIYIGKSLLENGNFSENDLKEFRIWQIQKMIEVTQIISTLSPTLPVPITTAQLIFVYNNELNIRFRMEEKKFDVDGAYNVRYEILKKRIDKATIKGTTERLTQSGKVAIVYLQDKEKREYLEYINFLKHTGAIQDEVEELELNRLPGAEGLKALRITVK
ncbi:MAG: hypothetical protein P1U56_14720 [Saprospiraceae bacterium]|nr:hypothetical protein [Saprospiraceae bacterium]